ncbi:MAG: glycosyltransferase, partial [Candidatus Saccharibacteria bacterium]
DQTITQRGGLVYKQVGDQPSYVQQPSRSEPKTSAQLSAVPRRSLVKRVAKKGLRVGQKFSPSLGAKLETQAKQLHMKGYLQVDFQKGDLFVIPWGEWWDPLFTDRVVRAHDKQGVRLVQVIHDVAPTVWPQFFEQVAVSPTTYNSRVVPIADLVLCVSQNTKRELTSWLKEQKLHVPRVEVFRLGDDIKISAPTKPHEAAFTASKLKGGDYLLCVGTIEAKKNHYLFYYVYKLAAQRGITLPKLVIVGRRGFHTDDMYDIMTRDPAVKDSFAFLHDASDEELAWLYDHCLFTVLASFHEGWGIPIAESVARGIPCLCSNTSSMVEIAEGKGVAHFAPTSSEQCLEGMLAWITKPKALADARQQTKKYTPSTWDEAFNQVMTQMEKI